MAGTSLSLILDGSQPCPADKPCFCNYDEIFCEGFNLDTVPAFKPLKVPSGHFAVNLAGNSLITIPSRAFANLIPRNDSEFDLFLPDNELTSIAPDAFDGIAERVLFLYLDENNFTTIPEAVEELTNIQELSISGNPIYSLRSKTLKAIGHSLEKFYIDLSLFKEWPRELQFLNVLKELYVEGVPEISSDAFIGFQTSLTTLFIKSSNVSSVPREVCSLPNLQTFGLVDNGQLVNDLFFKKCPKGMEFVTTVILSYNSLTTIPNVVTMFPGVKSLYLSYNNLSSITERSLQPYVNLTNLNLNDNHFDRIPVALGRLSQLQSLSIGNSQIHSIGNKDLQHFSQLVDLDLAGNPLETIYGQAFAYTVNLQRLYLQGTKLRILPESLTSLNHLQSLDLEQNPTVCDCSLSALKSWDVSQVYVTGTCLSEPVDVKTFITTRLAQCP